MEAIEHQLLEIIASVYNAMGWPGVVLLMAVETVFVPLPSEVVMPLSGWMLIQAKGLSAWYTLLAGLYGALGSLLGCLLVYGLGAWGGRPLLERYGRYLFITSNDLKAAEHWFSRYGRWAVLLARLIPVVRSLVSFPAGVARMPLMPFALLTFLGSFLWSWGLAMGGYLLGENWEALRRAMRPFDIPVLLAVAALVAFYLYRRVRSFRRQPQQVGK